jgi:hypothetical protein
MCMETRFIRKLYPKTKTRTLLAEARAISTCILHQGFAKCNKRACVDKYTLRGHREVGQETGK